MSRFLVGKISDITEGKMIALSIDKKKEILVVNTGNKYYAISNICTHKGARLHEGKLNDKQLICPWHGAKWDVTNGKLIPFRDPLYHG